MFYCIGTISVFRYIFFVLFCLVITLIDFFNLLLKFSRQKFGSWEDRQYCLYETTVDSQNYIWTLYLYIQGVPKKPVHLGIAYPVYPTGSLRRFVPICEATNVPCIVLLYIYCILHAASMNNSRIFQTIMTIF